MTHPFNGFGWRTLAAVGLVMMVSSPALAQKTCVPMGLLSPSGPPKVNGDQREYRLHQACTLQTNEIGEPVMKVAISGTFFTSTNRAIEKISLTFNDKKTSILHSLTTVLTCTSDPWTSVQVSCSILGSEELTGELVMPYMGIERPYSAHKMSPAIKKQWAATVKNPPQCDPNAKPNSSDLPLTAPKFSVQPFGFPGSFNLVSPAPLPLCSHPEEVFVQFQVLKGTTWSLAPYQGTLTMALKDGKGSVTIADFGGKKGQYRARAWYGGKHFTKNGKSAWVPFTL